MRLCIFYTSMHLCINLSIYLSICLSIGIINAARSAAEDCSIVKAHTLEYVWNCCVLLHVCAIYTCTAAYHRSHAWLVSWWEYLHEMIWGSDVIPFLESIVAWCSALGAYCQTTLPSQTRQQWSSNSSSIFGELWSCSHGLTTVTKPAHN